MTELILQQQLQMQAQEIAELRTLVLHLRERLDKWATAQRSVYAQQLGDSEDYLGTYYDKSLLVKRHKMVRQVVTSG